MLADRATSDSRRQGGQAVMVVGDKKDVKKAKECIKVLNKYHHTEVTHPGLCHDELEFDTSVHGASSSATAAARFTTSRRIFKVFSAHSGPPEPVRLYSGGR